MAMTVRDQGENTASGAIVLSDGTVFLGQGCGATGTAVGELCFNTAIAGYQEILTDPSYAEQIVMFTFPHIGNVGANIDDHEESSEPAKRAARGTVLRAPITPPSNWRAEDHFDAWLKRRGIVGVSGVDTRALTRIIREKGMQKAAIINNPDGNIDLEGLKRRAHSWDGIEGADLAHTVVQDTAYTSDQRLWNLESGYGDVEQPAFKVVVVDFGVKKNILRNLASVGATSIIVPPSTSAEDILAHRPDGVILSNGPGDPAATVQQAGPMIRNLIDSDIPILGICLGHQLLALSLGANTKKMAQGHHGANHPVKDHQTGKVEIVSMNHGFTVDVDTLPAGVVESHTSLFDGTNCGLTVDGKPIISVQHHPEASPGPQDSFYLFERFAGLMRQSKT